MDGSGGSGGWNGHGREHGACFARYLGKGSKLALPGITNVIICLMQIDRWIKMGHDWHIKGLYQSQYLASPGYQHQPHCLCSSNQDEWLVNIVQMKKTPA